MPESRAPGPRRIRRSYGTGCGLLSRRARALDTSRPPLPCADPPRLARRARRRRPRRDRAAEAPLEHRSPSPARSPTRARQILQHHFGERPDGIFTVVFRAHRADLRRSAAAPRRRREARARRARDEAPRRRRRALRRDRHDARPPAREGLHDARAARARGRAARFVTGQPAIQHDLDPVLSHDLPRRGDRAAGRARRALRRVRPLARRARAVRRSPPARSPATLAVVFALAHDFTMVTYVTNLVELIGLGLAIDYSLLVVYRFREELGAARDVDGAIVRTMATAGRAVVFSGSPSRSGSGCCSSCRCRSSARWASPACSSRSSRCGGCDAAAGAALAARRARHAQDRAVPAARDRAVLGAPRARDHAAAACASSRSAPRSSSPPRSPPPGSR